MLGLRHFNGHAIDLFLGDIAQFQNDGIVRFGPDFIAQLRALFANGHRQIAVDTASGPTLLPHPPSSGAHKNEGGTEGGGSPPAPAEQTVIPLMQGLHSFLNGADAKINHRITFVAPNHETYAKFQQAIFATFPDGELPPRG